MHSNLDLSQVDKNIDCSLPCPHIFKTFNSCPQRLLVFTQPHLFSTEDWLEILLMIFSSSPYILSFIILINTVIYKTTRSFFIVLMIFGQNFIVEILKNGLRDPRPNYLCSKQFGNPSNHAVYFASLLSWTFLENIYLEKNFCYQNTFHKIILIVLYPIILYSRYHLKYHTLEQLFNGFLIGIFVGSIWFVFTHKNFSLFGGIFEKLGVENNLSNASFKKLGKFGKILNSYQEKTKELENLKKSIDDFKGSLNNIDFIKNGPNIPNNKETNIKNSDMEEFMKLQNLSSILENNREEFEDDGEYDEDITEENLKELENYNKLKKFN